MFEIVVLFRLERQESSSQMSAICNDTSAEEATDHLQALKLLNLANNILMVLQQMFLLLGH